MELVTDRETKTPAPDRVKALLEATKKEGLLVGVGGMHGQTIRIGPSMLITADEMEEALTRLANACDSI